MQLAKVTVGYFEHEAKYLRYEIQVTGDSVWGNWDTERVNQILHNLISTAIKYGVSKQIEVNVSSDAEFAQLAVIDRGVGFLEDEETHIFKRLLQASVLDGNIEMGLGLWIVARLVDAMRGAFEVQSEPGEGARFLVRLPLNTY
jgi:signal transduction histidine kinase